MVDMNKFIEIFCRSVYCLYTVLMVLVNKLRKNTTKTMCHPCEGRKKNAKAVNWCIHCKEPLCNDCSSQHKVQKITKDHSYITIVQYESVSDLLSSIPKVCEYHTNNTLKYCRAHDALCCVLCKCDGHKFCNTTDRTNLEESESSVTQVQETIILAESVYDKRVENIKKLFGVREQFLAEVKDRQRQIKKLLSDLNMDVQHFDKDYRIKRQQLECEKQEVFDILEEIKKRKENQETLLQLKQLGSHHILFAEMLLRKQHEKDNIKINNYLQYLSDIDCKFHILFKTDKHNQDVKLDYDMSLSSIPCHRTSTDSNIPEIPVTDSSTIEDDEEFFVPKSGNESSQFNRLEGEVCNTFKVEKTVVSGNKFKTTTPRAVRNQMSKRCPFMEKKRKFLKKSHFQIEKENSNNIAIRCVQLLPKGQLVVSNCSDPRLLIYEKQGCIKGEIKLKYIAESIAVIDDVTIAVTMGQSVLIVDVRYYNSMKTVKEIPLSDNCYGIAYVDNKLLVNCQNDGLKIVTLKGHIVYTYYYIKGMLNICPTKEKTIVTIKRNSERVHIFNLVSKTRDIRHCPNLFGANGISRDEEGAVFVTCDHSNKVYMLPNGCTTWVSVLDSEDGIDYPQSLTYDKTTKELIVINKSGKSVYVYERECI